MDNLSDNISLTVTTRLSGDVAPMGAVGKNKNYLVPTDLGISLLLTTKASESLIRSMFPRYSRVHVTGKVIELMTGGSFTQVLKVDSIEVLPS